MSTTGLRRRRWGLGTLYQPKGSTIWNFKYVDQTGNRVNVSLKTRDRELAVRKSNAILATMHEAVPEPKADLSFEELAALVEKDYERNNRKTRRKLDMRKKPLARFFGGWKAKDINEEAIDAYIDQRKTEKTQYGRPPETGTINRELAFLKRGLNLAFRNRKLVRVPHVAIMSGENVREGFVEDRDFDRIVSFLPEHLKNPLRFAKLTGWRFYTEVLTLQWAQVSFDTMSFRLKREHSKTSKGRLLPILKFLEPILREQAAKRDRLLLELGLKTPYVFFYERSARSAKVGRPIKRCDAAWDRACEQAGLPGLLKHDLRRTAIRNMTRSGMPRPYAKHYTGHLTDSTYERYDIVDEPAMEEMGQLYVQYLERKTQPAEQPETFTAEQVAALLNSLKGSVAAAG